MTRIDKAREQLRLQGKDVIAVLQASAKPSSLDPPQKAANH